jgi:hypothetical protein
MHQTHFCIGAHEFNTCRRGPAGALHNTKVNSALKIWGFHPHQQNRKPFNISRVVPLGWVALQFEGGSPQSRPNFHWVRPHGLQSGLSFSIASTFPSQDFATLSALFPGDLVEPWGNWCQVCALRDCPPICMLSASLCMHVCLLVRPLGPSSSCALRPDCQCGGSCVSEFDGLNMDLHC